MREHYEGLDEAIVQRLMQQYQGALEELCAEMKILDRERRVVQDLVTKLETSGRPAPEHIPTLIELERITREAGGTAYVEVDSTVFREMAQLNHPDLIPFLLEAFQYRRRYDEFAARRRACAAQIAATIAARSGDPRAVDVLLEMLADPKPDIRGSALGTIYETYEWEGVEMPAKLVERCWEMAKTERSRSVRQTTLAVLHQMEQISYEEAVSYLEGES